MTTTARSRPSRCVPAVGAVRVMLLLAALLLTTNAATAQGTARNFPDPMSHDDALSLTAPLRLSPDQIEHLDRRHEAYLTAFRALRDGRIDTFLADSGTTWHRVTAKREDIVASIREQTAILGEIQQLDDAFLESLRTGLTESQAEWLPRIMARRERQRLETDPSNSSWQMPRLGRLDLTSHLEKLELSDAERDAIEPVLAGYEATITPIYQRIHAQRLELPLAMYDQHQAARAVMEERIEAIREQFDLSTPEGQKAFSDAMMEEAFAFRADALPGQEPIREDVVRISRASRTLLEDLRPLLDEANAIRLESTYVRSAYGALGIPRDALRMRVARHRRIPGTDETLLAAIEELYAGYLDARRPLVKRMIVAAEADDFRTQSDTFMPMPLPRARDEQPDKPSPVDEARNEIRELNTRTLEALAALTGEEIPTSARRTLTIGDGMTIELSDVPGAEGGGVFITDGAAGAVDVVMLDDGTGEHAIGEHAVGFVSVEVAEASVMVETALDDALLALEDASGSRLPSRGRRGWLPGPLSEELTNALAAQLETGETLRPVFDQLVADNRAAYDALRETTIDPAREQLRAVSRPWMGAGDPISPAEVSAAYANLRGAMAAILESDDAFFDDVATLFDRDADGVAIERARLARRRIAHSATGRSPLGFMPFTSGSQEGRTDLAGIVDDADLTDGDRNAAGPPLAEYDEGATTLFVERWSGELDAAERQARSIAEASEKRESGTVSFAFSMDHSEEERDAAATRRVTEDALATLNRQTLDELRETISEPGFLAVREAYERAAFPSVYRDGARLHALFDKALALDMPETERETVALLQAAYRAEYRTISERLIERTRAFHAEQPGMSGGMPGPESFQAMEAFQRDIEKDRFERDNLNQRTRRRLIDALDAERRAALGLEG